MFIKSINLSNFKGFVGNNNEIEFQVPNGSLGSGLNIFIGENNTGKSSVFEAIDFIRNGIKENLIDRIKSKTNTQENSTYIELKFCGNIEEIITNFVPDTKQESFQKLIINHGNENVLKVKRDTQTFKKIHLWNKDKQEFQNPSGIDAPFKTLFETNFIWANTNPSDEATFGSTTLCGLLLKEIAKAHTETEEYRAFQERFNNVFNNDSSELRQQLQTIENKVQEIFTKQFGEARIYFKFDELKIDSFFKNTSIFIDDGIDVPMTDKGNGMQRSVALALLQVYAEQICQHPSTTYEKPFYLFIDEPELCLHPRGQTKLLEALLEISRTKQVFLTTHSPYFLSTPNLKNAGLYIFKKEGNKNTVENANLKPMFSWSPTWGEINYKAYNMATVELHNELYGELQAISQNFSEKAFEAWLNQKGYLQNKKWTREVKGIPQEEKNVTLQTFIRNHIHHPENQTMQSSLYTKEELEQSIEEMINLLEQTRPN